MILTTWLFQIATIKSISPEYAGHLALITDALKDFFQKNTNHTYSSFFVNLMTADKVKFSFYFFGGLKS